HDVLARAAPMADGSDVHTTHAVSPAAKTMRRMVPSRRRTWAQLPHRWWHRRQMPRGVVLDAIGALEELHVGHDLLHRGDVDLTGAETGGAGVLLDRLAVRQVGRTEVQLAGRRVERVPNLLRVL